MPRPERMPVLAYSIGTAIILAFFVRFVLPACHAHFAPDDMTNLYYYWSRGPLQLAKGLLLFPSTYYRPMGGVFYSALYALFGLNPLPYHVAISALILVNSYLVFRFVSLISSSRLVAAMSALLATYHSYLAAMIYWPSFIYDVLCFTFFFSALNYYIAIREKDRLLAKREILVFTVLYICALESKEMAVSLPVILVLYEALWHAPAHLDWNGVRDWISKDGLVPLIAGAINLIFLVGKTSGSAALIRNEAYKPLFSWQRFIESNISYQDTLFYRSPSHGFTTVTLLLTWAVLFLVAWRRGEKHTWLMALFVILTPLPIAFLPPRAAGCLYIPLIGWAILFSTFYLSLAALLKKTRILRRLSRQQLRVGLALLAVPFIWITNKEADRRSLPGVIAWEQLTWSFLEQLQAAHLPVKPQSEIVFIDDPFSHGTIARWDAKFITELFYQDHTIKVLPSRMTPLSPDRIAAADLVLTWKDGRLVRWTPAKQPNPAQP